MSNFSRGQVLKEALDVLNDPDSRRMDRYGRPEDNFELIASYWSLYLEHPVRKDQVAMMMVLFKLAREMTGVGHADSVRDAAGYLGLYGDMRDNPQPSSRQDAP